MLQFPVSTALPPSAVSLQCASRAVPLPPPHISIPQKSGSQRLPANKVGASQARGKWRETGREREERKRGREEEKECLLHISAITLTTLLPFLMFFRVSCASRGRHLIVITSVSAARTHTLTSRPDERCIQGLRRPQEGKYMCEGKKLTEPHFSSHQTALRLLRLPSPCFTSPPPASPPLPISSGGSCECNW